MRNAPTSNAVTRRYRVVKDVRIPLGPERHLLHRVHHFPGTLMRQFHFRVVKFMKRNAALASLPLLLLATVSHSASAQPAQSLPVYGGTGGNPFTRDCGAGYVMSGLRGRAGLLVDAIGLLCTPVNSNGTLGVESIVATHAGGGGGEIQLRRCPLGHVVAGLELYYGMYLDGVRLICREWISETRKFGKEFTGRIVLGRIGSRSDNNYCGDSRQPASGFRGRASAVVDALGLICDDPR